jgi:hypothetical protein
VPYNRIPVLAKRHKLELDKSSASPVELLLRHISRYDESDLSRLLLEIRLLIGISERRRPGRRCSAEHGKALSH